MHISDINCPILEKVAPAWFVEWFDSPYYHLLYKNRNYEEASHFLDNLMNYFSFHKNHKILDLACGKGRHAIHLNQMGFNVKGLDLSPSNISQAQLFSSSSLTFQLHDMREPFGISAFDFVLNLFTSFGYFEQEDENHAVIVNMANSLKPDGYVVLDYLNPLHTLNHLVPFEAKDISGIQFEIRREVEKGFINKYITVKNRGITHHFKERVKLIFPSTFKASFKLAGMNVTQMLGDYNLQPFDCDGSKRMIIIGKKD